MQRFLTAESFRLAAPILPIILHPQHPLRSLHLNSAISLHDLFSGTLGPREIIRLLHSPDSKFLINESYYDSSTFPLGFQMWRHGWQPPRDLRQLLDSCEPGTFGHALLNHLGAMLAPGVDSIHSELPSIRFPLAYPCSFPDWVECRMQQTHDCLHVLLGLGVQQDDEMVLQAFYFSQGCQPMGMLYLLQELCSSFRTLRIDPLVFRRVSRLVEAIRLGLNSKIDLVSFPYEDHLGDRLEDLRAHLGIAEGLLPLIG